MISRRRKLHSSSMPAWLVGWAVLAAACREAPTQTHVVLEVHVASAIAKQVTSIVVHGQKRSGAATDDVSKASADYEVGDTPRFVLQPAADQQRLQVRVVALDAREEIASATLESWYSAGRGLYLAVELGCAGRYDLGKQPASESPATAIDSCDFAMTQNPQAGSGGAGGKSGSGGVRAAGSGGQLAKPSAGSGTGGVSGSGGTPSGGMGGSGGASGASGMATSGTGGTAGGGGGRAAGAGGAGSGGMAGQGTVGGTGAASGGGASGAAGAAGSSGAGAGAGGAGGSTGSGCLSWRMVDTLSDAIETLSPEAFIAGIEHRDNPTEDIKQFICRASPAGMTQKLVGKASKWGCYLPGPTTTAYTVTDNVEILISNNTAPCLTWKPLSPTQAPTSPLIFGDGSGAAHVCRVSHAGVAEGRNTRGERVGQVRLESAQYVCRYEFYYYVENMTRVNLPGETTQVLDLAP